MPHHVCIDFSVGVESDIDFEYQNSYHYEMKIKCVLYTTRKLTRLRRRIGLQVKLFLLNLYVVGSLPCILKSNWIGLQVKLGRGERERNEQPTGGK